MREFSVTAYRAGSRSASTCRCSSGRPPTEPPQHRRLHRLGLRDVRPHERESPRRHHGRDADRAPRRLVPAPRRGTAQPSLPTSAWRSRTAPTTSRWSSRTRWCGMRASARTASCRHRRVRHRSAGLRARVPRREHVPGRKATSGSSTEGAHMKVGRSSSIRLALARARGATGKGAK